MGLGGELMHSAVIKNIKKKYPNKTVLFVYKSHFKLRNIFNPPQEKVEVFKNNQKVKLISKLLATFISIFKNIINYYIYDPSLNKYTYSNHKYNKIIYNEDIKITPYILEKLGIECTNINPEIFLTEKERKLAKKAMKVKGLTNNKYLCFEPNNKLEFTPNKRWFEKSWQELIDVINNYININNYDINIVQIGKGGEKVFNNIIDLTGMLSFRETSVILKESLFFISTMSGLVHLAKAVKTQSIVLISGFEPKELASYPEDINLYKEIECSNCGLLTECPIDRKCMKLITPKEVANYAIELIEKNYN